MFKIQKYVEDSEHCQNHLQGELEAALSETPAEPGTMWVTVGRQHTARWSHTQLPQIGAYVHVKQPNVGNGLVIAYAILFDWLALELKLDRALPMSPDVSEPDLTYFAYGVEVDPADLKTRPQVPVIKGRERRYWSLHKEGLKNGSFFRARSDGKQVLVAQYINGDFMEFHETLPETYAGQLLYEYPRVYAEKLIPKVCK